MNDRCQNSLAQGACIVEGLLQRNLDARHALPHDSVCEECKKHTGWLRPLVLRSVVFEIIETLLELRLHTLVSNLAQYTSRLASKQPHDKKLPPDLIKIAMGVGSCESDGL